MKFILASASPRRAQILTDAGIRFTALSTDIDESRLPGEPGDAMVRRLAEAKARAALPRAAATANVDAASEPCIVIGADTVVEIGGDVLGKPGTAEAARAMLQRLSGTRHRVLTGVALLRVPDRSALGAGRVDVASTDVWALPR